MRQSESQKAYIFDTPQNYRICVHGVLEDHWAERLGGLRVTTSRPEGRPLTTLAGVVVDQAALVGILNTLYDLHLTLISVESINNA